MIKKVLVYTYGEEPSSNTILAAARFARQHDAELSGLFVRPDIVSITSLYGDYPLNLAHTIHQQQNDYAANAQALFQSIIEEVGCRAQWHEIEEFEAPPKASFYTDCIVVAQPRAKQAMHFNEPDFVDRLVIETGLPLIVIPRDWQSTNIAAKPVLGWRETKEAVSAVRLTLPLLRAAKDVDVVTVVRPGTDQSSLLSGIEIGDYLAAHGVKADYVTLEMAKGEKTEAESIVRHLRENQRDSIIIGGYGHSRFRETILGGVTRYLLAHSPAPLILAH